MSGSQRTGSRLWREEERQGPALCVLGPHRVRAVCPGPSAPGCVLLRGSCCERTLPTCSTWFHPSSLGARYLRPFSSAVCVICKFDQNTFCASSANLFSTWRVDRTQGEALRLSMETLKGHTVHTRLRPTLPPLRPPPPGVALPSPSETRTVCPPESSRGPACPATCMARALGSRAGARHELTPLGWLSSQLCILLVPPPPTQLVCTRDTRAAFRCLLKARHTFWGIPLIGCTGEARQNRK